MALVANARMYAVTPAVEAAWRALFEAVADRAGIPLAIVAHPAPAPLETLWSRDDLGLAFMCGLPFARAHPPMQPVAAPIPSRPRYGGRPVYRTNLVARADSGLSRLADAFGGRIGWTVDHSQSGYNALRHHLLRLRGDRAGPLFAESVGPLVTPRRVIEAVLSGAIDVGPLDSYWHDLLEAHEPDTAARLKTIDHTPLTPMPLLVAAPKAPTEAVERLRAALLGAAADPRLAPLLAPLLLSGFAPAAAGDYGPLLAQAAAAEAASYPAPA